MIPDLDESAVLAFLDHLESVRHNDARSRNLRLIAIRSFFKFVTVRDRGILATATRVLAIPAKRTSRPLRPYLTRSEMDALLAVPDRNIWLGSRDHALLLTMAADLECNLAAVTITGGEKAHRSSGGWNVPKRDVVAGLQVMLENGLLEIAWNLRERRRLVEDLMGMRAAVTRSRREVFGPGASTAHDGFGAGGGAGVLASEAAGRGRGRPKLL